MNWMEIRFLFRPMIIHDETLYFYFLMITLINNNYIDVWYDMTLWRCDGRAGRRRILLPVLIRILWWYQLTRTVPESVWHLDSLEPLESSWKYNQFGNIMLLQRVFGVSLWIDICTVARAKVFIFIWQLILYFTRNIHHKRVYLM